MATIRKDLNIIFLCPCETFFCEGIFDSEIKISSFSSFRCEHMSRAGSGVYVYAGYVFSGRPLARGDWKFWWAIGMHFNSRPPDDWK